MVPDFYFHVLLRIGCEKKDTGWDTENGTNVVWGRGAVLVVRIRIDGHGYGDGIWETLHVVARKDGMLEVHAVHSDRKKKGPACTQV